MAESAKQIILVSEVEGEIEVLRSRFIACLAPAKSPEEARDHMMRVKNRYPQASHYVPAFVNGSGNSVITHCSDAGEPSGTAGRPALIVLQGSGIGNISAVVVRYFGGTKLGTGGLVKAYTAAVQEALKLAVTGVNTPVASVCIDMEYSDYDKCEIFSQTFGHKTFSQISWKKYLFTWTFAEKT